MARSDPGDDAGTGRTRTSTARVQARKAGRLPPSPAHDPLASPTPATTRLAEEPVLLPTVDGAAVRLPAGLKARFKRAFPASVWDPRTPLYLVTGPQARQRLETWLAKDARQPVAAPKAKAPPPLRLTCQLARRWLGARTGRAPAPARGPQGAC